MNPCSETNSLGTLAAFHSAFVASPSRRRGLGKRTAFESSSPDSFVEALSSFSPFPSFTINCTVAPREYVFQDVYAWAGEFRDGSHRYGQLLFARPEHIRGELQKLFRQLAGEQYLRGQDSKGFCQRAAHYLGEINALHRCREGNNRVVEIKAIVTCSGRDFKRVVDFSAKPQAAGPSPRS